ncbi:MAG: methyltransferase [Clostridia bacterium]
MDSIEKAKKIRKMVNQYKVSYILIQAEKLGIFRYVDKKPKTSLEIAKALQIEENRLEPLLNALVCDEWICKNNKGYYLDEYLGELTYQNENSQLGYIHFAGDMIEKWKQVEKAIKEKEFSKENFKILTQEKASSFTKGMQDIAMPQVRYIQNHFSFKSQNILDIGAGAGTYGIELAKQDETLNATLLDLPNIAKILENRIKEERLEKQLQVLAKNYHEGLPQTIYDSIFLFSVIHQESKTELKKLIENCYKNLKEKGSLFLTSFFLNEDRVSPEFAVQFAIEMLVMSEEGKVYTHKEIEKMLKQVGFSSVQRIDEIPGPGTLYIAIK